MGGESGVADEADSDAVLEGEGLADTSLVESAVVAHHVDLEAARAPGCQVFVLGLFGAVVGAGGAVVGAARMRNKDVGSETDGDEVGPDAYLIDAVGPLMFTS